MEDRERPKPGHTTPANNNRLPATSQGFDAAGVGRVQENDEDADIAPWQRVDKAVLSIAGLIGRRMAREHFEALQQAQANDNASPARVKEGRETVTKATED